MFGTKLEAFKGQNKGVMFHKPLKVAETPVYGMNIEENPLGRFVIKELRKIFATQLSNS